MKLDDALRGRLIDGVIAALDKEYVAPDNVAKIEKRLRAGAKRYDTIRSPDKLAKQLTEDLQETSRDKQLWVEYSVEPLPADRPLDYRMPPDETTQMRTHAAQFNAFFVKLERLAGNIGYLRIDAFVHAMVAAAPAAAAMSFLADTDELIVDLRNCGGGEHETVAMLISYLYDAGDALHIADVHWRATDSTRQYWTTGVAGRRYAGKPLYVLTSNRTIAAGEDFAASVQALKRGKIVGEPTAGGVHPCRRRRLAPNFALILPVGRSISAVSQKDRQGGVKPDLKTDEAKALDAAYLAALRSQRKRIDPKRMPKDFVPDLSVEVDKALEKAVTRAGSAKKPKKR